MSHIVINTRNLGEISSDELKEQLNQLDAHLKGGGSLTCLGGQLVGIAPDSSFVGKIKNLVQSYFFENFI